MEKKQKIIFFSLIIVAAICVFYISFYFASRKKDNNAYDEIRNQAKQSTTTSKEIDTTKKSEEETTKKKEKNPINFKKLSENYPDIVAWIRIPDSDIDFPIMQPRLDNSYYLTHLPDMSYSEQGSIYIENYNKKDFSDFDTIVYGHQMMDIAMFGLLKQYKNKEFFDSHRTIKIYTKDNVFTYKVFAAVTYDNRHILGNFDFNSLQERQKYLDSIYALNDAEDIKDKSIKVDVSSKLLTLSTCVSYRPENRFLVEAVLVEE